MIFLNSYQKLTQSRKEEGPVCLEYHYVKKKLLFSKHERFMKPNNKNEILHAANTGHEVRPSCDGFCNTYHNKM